MNQLDRIERKLDTVLLNQRTIFNKEIAMSQELDALQADVAAEDTVIGSAVTLIQGISAKIDAAIAAAQAGDATALTALSADIRAKTQALADAVAANT